jgi:hypothetical protein
MDWEIGNYAFGAAAGHPFLKRVIDACARGQTDPLWRAQITASLPRALRADLDVIYSTGPGLVSRTLAESVRSEHTPTVLFPDDVTDRASWDRFGNYGVHLGSGTWRKDAGTWTRRLVNILGRRCESRAIRLGQERGPHRSLQSLK